MLEGKKRAWAEVKVSAIQYNCFKFKDLVPSGCKVMAVVKANAYGHGAVNVSKIAEKSGCEYLAVACLDEAEQLREAGIKLPILILGYTPAEFVCRAAELGCTQALVSLEAAREYSRALEKGGKTLKVHLKLETGMGRQGFNVKGGDVSNAVSALTLPGFEPEGVFTHFAVADEPVKDDYTVKQFKTFTEAVEKIEAQSGVKFALKHCANSAAALAHPEMCLDMVREGISLYGIQPVEAKEPVDLARAMEVKARVLQVTELEPGDSVSYGCRFTADRKMKVAVVALGYADGLRRSLSGKIDFIIRDRRCPQIGTICMDMCMVDVTGLEEVKAEDIAVYFGHEPRNGRELITVDEVAEKAGTIPYEILCAVSPRVPRLYIE